MAKGCGTVVIIVLALIMWSIFQGGYDDAKRQEANVAAFDPVKQKQCDSEVASWGKSGLLRERPAADRINVNELKWAMLPASEKAAAMQILACAAFGRPLSALDQVVVYGYRSGKRLAMLTEVGPRYE